MTRDTEEFLTRMRKLTRTVNKFWQNQTLGEESTVEEDAELEKIYTFLVLYSD